MLIVCSGPDTLNARRKARELQAAFRTKYDPAGYSTEVVTSPSLDQVIQKVAAQSLFSPKRYFRSDGLLEHLKSSEIRALVQRLATDPENTILVSVEEKPPTEKMLTELRAAKVIQYSFPALQGSRFFQWCKKRARELRVSEQVADRVAQHTNGDTWLAEQELIKCAANPSAPIVDSSGGDEKAFVVTDAFLRRVEERLIMLVQQDADVILPLLLSQVRFALRVRDRAMDGLHPYVIKKLSTLLYASHDMHALFLACAQALTATRTGLALGSEKEALLFC